MPNKPQPEESTMSRRMSLIFAVFAIGLTATACGSSDTTSPTNAITTTPLTVPSTGATPQPTTSTTTAPVAPSTTGGGGAVDPNAPEVVEPGDIPDNQVFVAFPSADGSYSVKVPEGWAQTENGGVVVFTDKYNSVTISSTASTAAAVVNDVRVNGLADVSADPTFRLVDVQPVTRKAGDGVLATYEIGSAPNQVTGKKALLAVERYVFNHQGTTVVLTLSGAKGADNVDPWKIVSDSLKWTR